MNTQKQLMRQKVNVTPTTLAYWKRCMEKNLRCIINKWLIKAEDFGKTFEHQGRVFEIVGMTETDENTILKEIIDETPVYWQATTDFVQSKLGMFYVEWTTVAGHKITKNRGYDLNSLYLPPNKPGRKKKAEAEEEETPVMETYVEDNFDEEDVEY